MPFETRVFWWVLFLIVAERVVELALSRRNAQRVIQRGGREFGRGHYPWMVALHAGFFVALGTEVASFGTLAPPLLFWSSLFVVASSMGLRYWAISHLGDRWNTRVLCEPKLAVVTSGPYRWFRHPNYVAVVLELAFLPLLGGAWRTALVFSLLNFWMLRVRIRIEEAALREHCLFDERFTSPVGPPRG